jgi:hypothetical protein
VVILAAGDVVQRVEVGPCVGRPHDDLRVDGHVDRVLAPPRVHVADHVHAGRAAVRDDLEGRVDGHERHHVPAAAVEVVDLALLDEGQGGGDLGRGQLGHAAVLVVVVFHARQGGAALGHPSEGFCHRKTPLLSIVEGVEPASSPGAPQVGLNLSFLAWSTQWC